LEILTPPGTAGRHTLRIRVLGEGSARAKDALRAIDGLRAEP